MGATELSIGSHSSVALGSWIGLQMQHRLFRIWWDVAQQSHG
jgi:hypothetical protein